MREEQRQFPSRYLMALARTRAQVNLMRDQRARLRNLRSELANTLSMSKLLEYSHKARNKQIQSMETANDRPEAHGLRRRRATKVPIRNR